MNFRFFSAVILFLGKISATTMLPRNKIFQQNKVHLATLSCVQNRHYIFENAHQKILIATPSPLPLLINFWPKMRNEPNRRLKTDKKVNVI